MSPDSFEKITARYSRLRVAVIGDFCLDRYLEIDPEKAETSIETGLPVHNVVRVRSQPGAAGTILNNLAALGVGELYPVGFAGEDGEGYELLRCLRNLDRVRLDYFRLTAERRTFTYCKPLIVQPNQPPRELNRLDSKNWTPTPIQLNELIADDVRALATKVDAMIVMDQVDLPQTGVITKPVLHTIAELSRRDLLVVADSRRGLRDFPPVTFKMNSTELAKLVGRSDGLFFTEAQREASALAKKNGRVVFVTMAEKGIIGAASSGAVDHAPALPTRGEIDVAGAGDAVTASLTCALAAGGGIKHALELANAAASVVIHQLGTTGTASVAQLRAALSL